MSNIISDLSEWKLEAKLEDNNRYFYFISEVTRILSGARNYVIGRKGSGKTAISEYIYNISEPQVFTEKLTFKNFPFQQLYDLKSANYIAPNQYISAWKYLIYTFVCRMMARNEGITGPNKIELLKIFDPAPVKSLKSKFKELTNLELGGSFLGTGAAIKVGHSQKPIEQHSLDEKAQLLEDWILKSVDNSSYYIIFDELDEDYKDVITKGRKNEYTDLLTSLFKAVQDIKSIFRDHHTRICPIVFLRDDIYDILSDPDKNKWSDLKIDLNWNVQLIKRLLAFRIARANDATARPQAFEQEWSRIFLHSHVKMGDRGAREMSIFDYITRSTLIRPRDYIKFLQVSAEMEIANGCSKISATTVKKVDTAMSNYLRNELHDEMHGLIPDIDEVFDLISQIRKQTFSFAEFKWAYEKRHSEKPFSVPSAEIMCKFLFHFSVIGNQPKQRNVVVYRYLNREARFRLSDLIVVHRGLFKSLQIL